MRAYLMGAPLKINQVTWEILCHPTTCVNLGEDKHIYDWPEKIQQARDEAPEKIIRLLGLSG